MKIINKTHFTQTYTKPRRIATSSLVELLKTTNQNTNFYFMNSINSIIIYLHMYTPLYTCKLLTPPHVCWRKRIPTFPPTSHLPAVH